MEKRTSKGLYLHLVGNIVRVFSGGTNFLGRLDYTGFDTTELMPHLVGLGSVLEKKVVVVYDLPKILITQQIVMMESLPVDEKYLEKIVEDARERDSRQKFLALKDLREKGYFEQEKLRIILPRQRR